MLTARFMQPKCRRHGDSWLRDVPGSVVVRLLMPRLQLLDSTLSAVKNGLRTALTMSSVPTAAPQYPSGARLYGQDRDHAEPSTPLEQRLVKAVLYNVAWHCDQALKRNTSLSITAMQQLLPGATPTLPLPL